MQFKWMFILLACLAQNRTCAQVRITSLELGARNQWLSYSFPFIHSSNKSAAQKINYYLQHTILENDTILTDTNRVFEKRRFINLDSFFQSGYSDISYVEEINNSRVLSLIFQLESTGAYSENYTEYYNFNVRTGEPILAKDIFTLQGIAEIKKSLVKERKKRIEQWVKEMGAAEDSTEIIETFSECNARVEENNFLIKENSIVFCKGYCFPHVVRPYDTDLDVEMTYSKIQKYLSDAGKKLLITKK